jgi:hypothetical protein
MITSQMDSQSNFSLRFLLISSELHVQPILTSINYLTQEYQRNQEYVELYLHFPSTYSWHGA